MHVVVAIVWGYVCVVGMVVLPAAALQLIPPQGPSNSVAPPPPYTRPTPQTPFHPTRPPCIPIHRTNPTPPTHTLLQGLISSIGLMPVTFILPPLMWLTARTPRGPERWANLAILVFSCCIAALSFVGSLRNIVVSAQNYSLFD